MSAIQFDATPFELNSWLILLLPAEASKQLPSRGIVMIKGTMNDVAFETALEPDGRGSHWFKIEKSLAEAAEATPGNTVTLAIEPTKEWTEPEIPDDVQTALEAHPKAYETWTSVTPMARREWIRWIRATSKAETRANHIEVACSKLEGGMRRPCCFNSNMCTEPSVSKGGVLLEPAQVA